MELYPEPMWIAAVLILAQVGGRPVDAKELAALEESLTAIVDVTVTERVTIEDMETAEFVDVRFDARPMFSGEIGRAHFSGVRFVEGGTFANAHFLRDAFFGDIDAGAISTFEDADFEAPATFVRIGGERLLFTGRRETIFHKEAAFAEMGVTNVDFFRVTFEGRVAFRERLDSNISFSEVMFMQPLDLDDARFGGRLSFRGSTFKQGLDLRFADLSKAEAVVLDRIRIDPRDLRISWSSLRGKLDVDHAEKVPPAEWFPRLDASYRLAGAALKAQDDDKEAEAALQELEIRRQQAFGGFWHGAYGLLLGYGYEPWRVVFVVIPLIAVFALLFVRYRALVANILDDDIKKGGDEAQARVSKVARVAHLRFFSTAVLLGIRFRQEWIEPANTPFVLLVTAEWLIGIALYVVFFALVKTSGFAYVKGLLGF